MRPAVRKGTPIGTGIAFVLILLAADASAVAAELTPLSLRAEATFSILLEQLAQTIREETGRSTRLLPRLAGDSAGRGISPYSGAPLLSFYDATPFAPGVLPFSSFGRILIRLCFVSALALALFFPSMAIGKGTVHLRRKGRTWIALHRSKVKKHPPAAGSLPMKRA